MSSLDTLTAFFRSVKDRLPEFFYVALEQLFPTPINSLQGTSEICLIKKPPDPPKGNPPMGMYCFMGGGSNDSLKVIQRITFLQANLSICQCFDLIRTIDKQMEELRATATTSPLTPYQCKLVLGKAYDIEKSAKKLHSVFFESPMRAYEQIRHELNLTADEIECLGNKTFEEMGLDLISTILCSAGVKLEIEELIRKLKATDQGTDENPALLVAVLFFVDVAKQELSKLKSMLKEVNSRAGL